MSVARVVGQVEGVRSGDRVVSLADSWFDDGSQRCDGRMDNNDEIWCWATRKLDLDDEVEIIEARCP